MSLTNNTYKKHFRSSALDFYRLFIYLNVLKLFKKNIIAICLIEHIGDIVANEPILRTVRSENPNSYIVWFTKKPYLDLIKYHPDLNKAFGVNCLTTWILLKKKLYFQKTYELHFNGRNCTTCQIPLKKDVVVDYITGKNYFNYGSLLNVSCLTNNITVADEYPKIYLPEELEQEYKSKIKFNNYIVIHCRSNESIKDWEDNKWVELISQMTQTYNLPIIEVGNVSKLKVSNRLYFNYCGKLKLLETASLIKNATLFIGIDSGPAHMANAFGTPGVILLGEYFFGMRNYNPYSGNYTSSKKCSLVYSANFVKDITLNQVFKGIEDLNTELTGNLIFDSNLLLEQNH